MNNNDLKINKTYSTVESSVVLMEKTKIKVRFNDKYFELLNFIEMYKREEFLEDIPWIKLPTNVELHVGYNHYCKGYSIFRPLIAIFNNSIKYLIFKCETCNKYFIGNEFLNANHELFNNDKTPLLFNNKLSTKQRRKQKKKKEVQVLKFPKLCNMKEESPYSGLTQAEKREKWNIEHPYRGGDFSGK